MYQSVGEVYLKSISKMKVEPSGQTQYQAHPINQPFTISTSGKKRLREMEIRGYLFNDANKTRKEYASDLDALQGRSAAYNRIQLEDIDGYLASDSPEIRNANDMLNIYLLYGKLLPVNEYDTYYQYRQTQFKHGFERSFPSYITLPFGVRTMNLTNKSGESFTYPKTCDVVTPEGSLPVFKFPDWFTVIDSTYMADVVSSDDSARYQSLLFNSVMEYAEWTFIPGYNWFAGGNRFAANCKISESNGEILNIMIRDENGDVVHQENFPLDNTEMKMIYTEPLNLEKYKKYTVRLTKVYDQILLQYNFAAYNVAYTGLGNINVDLVRMDQVYTTQYIRFTTPAPNRNKGECKVYDTVTGTETDKMKWKRVYSLSAHKFTGHIVFENATMQWRINPTATWSATGLFTDRISNATGTLYPEDFKTTEVDIGIVELKPDQITIVFNMRDTNKLSKTLCTITPLGVYFRVEPYFVYDNAMGWRIDVATNTSKGVLDTTVDSMVMFTPSSSIAMIKSNPIPATYSTNGFYSGDGTASSYHSFAITVLPRVTDNTNKLFHGKNVSGADYYVDGEYIDTGKTTYLSDFINALYTSGLMVNMNITHKLYGDYTW